MTRADAGERRGAVMAEARTWVGTPFRHQARLKGVGVDCAQLVMAVGEAAGVMRVDAGLWRRFAGYGRAPNPRRMADAMHAFLAPIDEAEAARADIVWLAWRPDLPMHLAILAESGGRPTLIHALSDVGRVAEHGFAAAWEQRVHSWWRYPGLAAAVLLAALAWPQPAEAAALALGFVGAAVGGSIGGTILGISAATIGGFIGSTIGGLIDNILFAGTQKVQGPRLDDLTVTGSTYGVPIALAYGPQVRMSGNIIWSSGLIEVVRKEKQGGKGGPSVETTTYSYHVHLAVAIAEGELVSVRRIWGNSKLIYDGTAVGSPPVSGADLAGEAAVARTIRFYPGSLTQDPDPLIESFLGAGQVPGYRGTSYVVFERLELADFGNIIPNLEFEVEAHEQITVAGTVRDICRRAGVDEVSAYALTDDLKGYAIGRAGTAVAALEPLALAYGFDTAEQRGQIRCVKRGGALRAVIMREDMGGREAGQGAAGDALRVERQPDLMLPREAALTFSDPALDYLPNTQTARRLQGSSQNNLSHEIPVVMDVDEGRRIADRLLFEAWTARRSARFATSDRWVHLNPADIIGIKIESIVVPFKLDRGTRGANGVLQWDARFEDPEVYRSNAAGTPGRLLPNPVLLPGVTRLQLIDSPGIHDDAGFYWGAAGAAPGWRGASIRRSSDGGDTYTEMSRVAVRAGLGDVAVPLPAGPADVWDRANVLTVVLEHPGEVLESLAETAVLNGANAFWLGPASGRGGEIVQFASAALVAERTYELRDLLRGRLGTEHAIAGHGADEVFVLFDSAIGRSDFGPGDWNKERLYKPVSVFTTEADTAAQAFTNTGEGKRPRSPVHVRGARDAGNDLTITWVRRSRLLAPGLGNGPVPLGEAAEAYEVDILAGSPPAVVRTIVAATPQALYTAAAQTADGLTPGDPVSGNVYQLSDVRGRGRPGAFTV